MDYEERKGEILSVREVNTEKQTAIVRTHHTWFKHAKIQGCANNLDVGEVCRISFAWEDWQGNALDDEQEPFSVAVGEQVVDVPVGETLEFSSDEPGEYTIKTVNRRVQNAELVVTVDG